MNIYVAVLKPIILDPTNVPIAFDPLLASILQPTKTAANKIKSATGSIVYHYTLCITTRRDSESKASSVLLDISPINSINFDNICNTL